jgi:hypothetical protein
MTAFIYISENYVQSKTYPITHSEYSQIGKYQRPCPIAKIVLRNYRMATCDANHDHGNTVQFQRLLESKYKEEKKIP